MDGNDDFTDASCFVSTSEVEGSMYEGASGQWAAIFTALMTSKRSVSDSSYIYFFISYKSLQQ